MKIKNITLTALFIITLILSPSIMAVDTVLTQDQIDCKTAKELKADLHKLKESYENKKIDKETYKQEHKKIVDRLRTMDDIKYSKDEGLVDDVLFSGAETNLGVPASTAEAETEYIEEKNLDAE